MKHSWKINAMAFAVASVVAGSALAARPQDKGPPVGGESGVNNLSFPVILSDNATPGSFPVDGVWKWATITDPLTQCIDEDGVTPGTPVPPEYLCYYGGKVNVTEETGTIEFIPPTKVWWLQKRPANFWKALSVGHDVNTPLVVSAVDIGDLLESSPSIATRQIRVEFNLLQSVAPDDPEMGQYVVPTWDAAVPVPSPCVVPTTTGQSIGCFAAFGMSGAVPGTEQSGNEMQGNDFGPAEESLPTGILTPADQARGGSGNNAQGKSTPINTASGLESISALPGTQTLLDPATVRVTDPDVGGIQALVYSRCARLLIQKIGTGVVAWDKTTGQWDGTTVSAPVVNLPAYTNAWSTEITSGGSIVYGYNWNAKTASTGLYRLTFVLDGNDDEGPQCTSTLATKFEAGVTQLVNLGENNTSTSIVYAGDADLGDEGGIAYIDLNLTAKGGGGKGGR